MRLYLPKRQLDSNFHFRLEFPLPQRVSNLHKIHQKVDHYGAYGNISCNLACVYWLYRLFRTWICPFFALFSSRWRLDRCYEGKTLFYNNRWILVFTLTSIFHNQSPLPSFLSCWLLSEFSTHPIFSQPQLQVTHQLNRFFLWFFPFSKQNSPDV